MQEYTQYQKTMSGQFHQDSTETLMVKLFDGMIKRVKQSKDFLKMDNEIKSRELTLNAMRIAEALMDNINFEEGGETAQNLEKLYFYIINELSSSTRAEDPHAHLDRALNILEILHKGWVDLEQKAKKAALEESKKEG